MGDVIRIRSSRVLVLLALIFLQLFSGCFADSSITSHNTGGDDYSKSNRGSGSVLLIVLLALLAVTLLSFFLYRLWQKRKRAEEYARLLKLFEEDDDIELELGVRD